MKNNNIILNEGFNPILISLIVSIFLILFISNFLGDIALIFTIILTIIYRNPARNALHKSTDIIAPIDGKISAIDITKNKYKIYINVNLCNTHVLRAPIKSKIKLKLFKNGLNLNHDTYKAKLLNTQAVLKFDDIKLTLISGICNSKITLYPMQKVQQSQEFGVFLQGSVIVEVPKSKTLNIVLNDKVFSGITKLA